MESSSNVSTQVGDPANELRRLAAAIHRARASTSTLSNMDSIDNGSDMDPHSLLQLGLPHFAASRQALRRTAYSNKADKAAVANTRATMDAAYLALQNRMYEISHLYREIDRCNDYEWARLQLFRDTYPILTRDRCS